MPIEIRELIIRAEVEPSGSETSGGHTASAQLSEIEKEKLIKEITNQVLEKLKLLKEP